MNKTAYLVLQDGSIYQGQAFGSTEKSAYGEVVFNTSMTGYQELLTDPSYSGQIVMPTYPLIGNYGINEQDFESGSIQVSGFVVREHCVHPSHSHSTQTIDEYISSQGVLGISGVDTRAITRRLRTRGVMMGIIAVDESPQDALERLRWLPKYEDVDFVKHVSTRDSYNWHNHPASRNQRPNTGPSILVSDYGLKYNILRILHSKGCNITAFPASASVQDILAHNPDGVVLSPGPGDPDLLDYAVDITREIIGKVPILGICLGNQVIAKAFGGSTFKLKFGHRGANHPVLDTLTKRVYITAQNHGYAVDPGSLPTELEVSHINLHDNTVEGLRHVSLPIMSVQYHSEASPGPLDNAYIFDQFLSMVEHPKARVSL